jgi:regulator of replication initiation timing
MTDKTSAYDNELCALLSESPIGREAAERIRELLAAINDLSLKLGELTAENSRLGNELFERSSRLGRALELLRAVQSAKQKPGISNGEDSGSFNVVLHGNWFIIAASVVATSGDGAKAFAAAVERQ